VSLDFALDDAQQAIADSVARFCEEHGAGAEAWSGLAELGVLALATPEGDGGAIELVAAVEALGAANFPGPVVATAFATQVLPREERLRVAAGELVAAVGVPPLLPFAPRAGIFLELAGDRVFRARPRGAVLPVATLGGEPWGRVELEREADLGSAARGLALADLVLAAYLAAAGGRLLAAAAEHARTRRQFGQPIGEFQAVAHPLADRAIELAAAATLARIAACRFDAAASDRRGFDAGATSVRADAAAARLSASHAALETAYTAHQVLGGTGVTVDGPVFGVSRRIRELASHPPGDRAAREAVLVALAL
jgi:alkylation response protein AidB-like acyl-CoA dehydrogenase